MPITRLALRCLTSPYPDIDIAYIIGVSHPHFSKATLGKATLSPPLLVDLAIVFGCDPDQLAGWADDGYDLDDPAAEAPCLDPGLDQ